MSATARSPHITHVSWGRMKIEGVGEGKDCKLWPGGGKPWVWRETGPITYQGSSRLMSRSYSRGEHAPWF